MAHYNVIFLKISIQTRSFDALASTQTNVVEFLVVSFRQ